MTSLFTIGAAVIPSFLLLLFFLKRDLHPEPIKTISITFLLGVLLIVPVLAFCLPVEKYLFDPKQLADPRMAGLALAFLFAAIPEELVKYTVLRGYAVRSRHFDEPMDGIVYGVTASLGFATLENIMYTFSGGLSVALLRAFTAVPAHAFMGAVMGYYVGQMKFNKKKSGIWMFVLALFWPIMIHGLYDFPLMILNVVKKAEISELAFVPISFIALGGAGAWSFFLVRRLRKDQKSQVEKIADIPVGRIVPEQTITPNRVEAPPPVAKIVEKTAPAIKTPTESQDTQTKSKTGAWVLIVIGAILAFCALLLMVFVVIGVMTNTPKQDELVAIIIGSVILGVAPFITGLVLFFIGRSRLKKTRK